MKQAVDVEENIDGGGRIRGRRLTTAVNLMLDDVAVITSLVGRYNLIDEPRLLSLI